MARKFSVAAVGRGRLEYFLYRPLKTRSAIAGGSAMQLLHLNLKDGPWVITVMTLTSSYDALHDD